MIGYKFPLIIKVCEVCGCDYEGVAHRKYCDVCTNNRRKKYRREHGISGNLGRVRKFKSKRIPYKVADVMERDNHTCQICGVKTPIKLRGKHKDRSPEIDHIVPLAKGGADTYDNVQCLCRKCNQKKGDKMIGQLRMPIGMCITH